VPPAIIEGRNHRELAREAARQSLVRLKNEGHLLPLDKNKLKIRFSFCVIAEVCMYVLQE
jgi:beta-glucosidase-like glycosyl hydrolase